MTYIISPAQRELLIEAQQGNATPYNNLNTITALYCRGMIKFTGPQTKRLVRPTKLGEQLLNRLTWLDQVLPYKDQRNDLKAKYRGKN